MNNFLLAQVDDAFEITMSVANKTNLKSQNYDKLEL